MLWLEEHFQHSIPVQRTFADFGKFYTGSVGINTFLGYLIRSQDLFTKLICISDNPTRNPSLFGELFQYCCDSLYLYFVSLENDRDVSAWYKITRCLSCAWLLCFLTRSKRNPGIDAQMMRFAAFILWRAEWRHGRSRNETKCRCKLHTTGLQ